MDELDDLLARYRPIGPPADLRDRITAAAERPASQRSGLPTVVEWLPAAAMLALSVLFRWLAANERQMIDAQFTPVPPINQTVSDTENVQR